MALSRRGRIVAVIGAVVAVAVAGVVVYALASGDSPIDVAKEIVPGVDRSRPSARSTVRTRPTARSPTGRCWP